ncbi:ATP-dependent RNA helicase [Pseudoloma neurophilia]|uniref:ATP-dependent RNA helicase n=1 Tax=Pseudoloma neurophilia TaxID=146866 RepID=A0A0R0LYH7_9MICR|nr:ATP-dependent RNA helicase [Pseudoloma neurophilia]
MTKFENLRISKETIERLNRVNIFEPTQIQTETLKNIQTDLIVQSPTGTGKTLAFVIPIAEKLQKEPNLKMSAVILVPTRELALQVSDVLQMIKIANTVLIGGTENVKEFNPVIVATPGRFNQVLINSRSIYVDSKNTSLFSLFKKLDFLILDEADKLLSLGFRTQLNSIVRQIKAKRNLLFSATFNENISTLCKSFLKTPKHIKNEQKIHLDIKFLKTTPFSKIFYLLEILKKYKRVIVFFLTCNEVEYFTALFSKLGISDIIKIHGKMEQKERNEVYSSFKSILFGTDLASRGIDFKNVDIVVHFDIPLDPESFLHRSGRSGRNNQKGKALLFVTENEEKYLNFLKIKNIQISEETEVVESQIKNQADAKRFLKTQFNITNLPNTSQDDLINEITTSDQNILPDDKTDTESVLKNALNEFIDDKLLEMSVRAFVSHISAYKEHALKFLLDFKKLDFDSLANLHFLKKIPTMKELGDVKFKNFVKESKKEKKKYKKINL